MKKWKAIISAFALALCASVTAVGFGGWIIQGGGNTQYDKYYDANAKKVAYTRTQKGLTPILQPLNRRLKKRRAEPFMLSLAQTRPLIRTARLKAGCPFICLMKTI